jgi:hypothetical protein
MGLFPLFFMNRKDTLEPGVVVGRTSKLTSSAWPCEWFDSTALKMYSCGP